jgi:deferrochelatase/peroxidase EfeB
MTRPRSPTNLVPIPQELTTLNALPDKPIDPKQPIHADFLHAIQGNILQGHGRPESRLIFFRFNASRPAVSNRELIRAAVRDNKVTSAWTQYRQARNKVAEPCTVFRSLALTIEGMRKLGFTQSPGPGGSVVVTGHFAQEYPSMFAEGAPRTLFDKNGEQWTQPYDQGFDGMWIVACRGKSELDRAVVELVSWATNACAGLTFAAELEEGTSWRHQGRQREPFGFVDGISVPNFFASRKGNPRPIPIDRVFISPSDSAEHAGGSFLVLYKLEQNVRAFRTFETKIWGELRKAAPGGPDHQYRSVAPALTVGRFRNGRPLVDAMGQCGGASKLTRGTFNSFDFSHDPVATGCPFHAHIRRMNPRANAGQNETLVTELRRQIVRRSALYDPRGLLAAAEKQTTALRKAQTKPLTPEKQLGVWPEKEVGLLFMAYMRGIENQFNTLITSWAQDGNFPQPDSGAPDPLLFAGTPESGSWNWRGLELPPAPRFVIAKGGAFFYVPSMVWLRSVI